MGTGLRPTKLQEIVIQERVANIMATNSWGFILVLHVLSHRTTQEGLSEAASCRRTNQRYGGISCRLEVDPRPGGTVGVPVLDD